MTDHYAEAVKSHKAGQVNAKEFAYHAAHVSGERTAELAQACGLSVDAVENYRRAYHLYYRNCESVTLRVCWDLLNVSMFITAAKHEKDYTDTELVEKLAEARERKYTVEQFRAVLSVGNKPEWAVRIERGISNLWKLYTDYKPELEPGLRSELEQAAKNFFDVLKKVAEAE